MLIFIVATLPTVFAGLQDAMTVQNGKGSDLRAVAAPPGLLSDQP
jgi:hypothetical protein